MTLESQINAMTATLKESNDRALAEKSLDELLVLVQGNAAEIITHCDNQKAVVELASEIYQRVTETMKGRKG
jgi:hypothetical protein